MLLYICSCVTLLPQAAQDGLALCHLSRPDTSRGVPSQGRHRSKVCACRSLQEPRLTRWSANGSNWPLQVEGAMRLFLCHTLMIRPAVCASVRRGAGRSRRTSYWSGSSARREGLEEARLVNLARQSSVFPVLWQAIPVMIRLQRGYWATSRRRSSRRALQVCVSSIVAVFSQF